MTQAVVQVRNIVARSGFANPLTLEVLVTDEDYLKVYADTTLLDNGPDYEITGIGDPNGISIEIIGAEDVDNYVGVISFVAVYEPPLDQQGDLSAGGVLGRNFESALDQQNRRLQSLGDRVARSLKVNVNIDGDIILDPVDGQVPVWNEDTGQFDWTESPASSAASAAAAAASAAAAAADADEAVAAAAAAATAEANAETAEAAAEAAQAAAEAAAADAANKLPLDGSAPMTGPIRFTHQASPANPAAGLLSLFAKSDNKMYTRTSAGVEVGLGSGDVIEVADRAALRALDTTKDTVAIMDGYTWVFRLGNYTARVAADTLEGVFVKATAISAGTGCWVRAYFGALDVDWFGSFPNSATDSAAAFNAAYALLKALSGTSEGSIGNMVALGGYYTIGSQLEFDKPFGLYVPGYLRYTPTTGSCIVIGVTIPVSSQNTGYDIKIGGLRAMNGNASAPTGYNASGCSGVEIRNMQFSTLWVGRIIAFTKAGFWGNQTNDVYALQHCQDNTIHLGDVAYCGEGVRVESVDAALGAFQVNWVQVQNSFGNWTNFRIGGTGDNNTNNNLFVFHAMDADTGGGGGFVRGLYNDLHFGYADGVIAFESGSAYNRCYVQVGAAQVVFTDAGTANQLANATEGWITPGTATPPIRIESTDAGVTAASLLKLKRNSPSPAANDGGVAIDFHFSDDAGVDRRGGRIRTDMPTVETGGNRNMRFLFETIVGGTEAVRAILWQGLAVGNVADLGAGTINALTRIYTNGVPVPERIFASVQGSAVSLSNSSTSAQAIFAAANDTLTMAASTTYRFRAKLFINTGTTTHTTAFGFGGTATVTSMRYQAKLWSGTSGTINTTAPSVVDHNAMSAKVLNATSGAAFTMIEIEGTIRVNGAGTLIPQITFSAGPTGTCEVAVDSYIEFEPLGSNTIAAAGSWA